MGDVEVLGLEFVLLINIVIELDVQHVRTYHYWRLAGAR